MNQHEWVYGCYQYYLDNYIEPGNPEDGVWEDAHWPVPECKGGTKTIPLLKEHHAVQGVLQSEEWGHPCIYGWEKKYLTGSLLERCKYWIRTKGKLGATNRTPEQRSEIMRKSNARRTPEQRSEIVRKGRAKMTPKQRSEIVLKGKASMTPEQRSEAAKKGRAGMTPEQRSEAARKAWETKRRKQQGG